MFRKVFFLSVLALFVVACGSDANTIFEPETQLDLISTSELEVVRVENSNTWEVWPFTWRGTCTTRQFLPGTYRVHLQTQMKYYSDGSVSYRQHLNSAGGTIWDVFGNEYVLQQITKFTMEGSALGDQYILVKTSFRVISKSAEVPNEFADLTLTMHIRSDGSNEIISSVVNNCRGRL